MANADKPVGAVPYGRSQMNRYVAGGTVYPGDFVKKDNSGRIVAASASNALIGVAASYASGAGVEIRVYDDPEQKFIVQSDDATDPDAQTDIGLNYNIVATAGDSSYKASRMEVDGSTGATDSTLPLRLLDIVQAPDNAFGAQAKCIVKINNHQLGNKIEGV